MPRKTALMMAQPSCMPMRVWARCLLCAFSLLALGAALLPSTFSPISAAHAQQTPNAATQELFLAVDLNNLQKVREAINKGADIEARDFTGTQPVDMAIDRGYFEIARYLISVRNSRQNQQDVLPQTSQITSPAAPPQTEPQPADPDPFETIEVMDEPSLPESPQPAESTLSDPFSVTDDANALPQPPSAPEPLEQIAETANPFDVVPPTPSKSTVAQEEAIEQTASTGEAEPKTAPDVPSAPSLTVNQAPTEPELTQQIVKPQQAAPEKDSAAKTFVTTFFDFFKPPNVTGVIHRKVDRQAQEESVSEVELARQLDEIKAERGDEIIKGPAVPFSPDQLAQELPPAPQIPAQANAGANDELAAAPLETPELPPYSVGTPQAPTPLPAQDDVFGDLAIEEVTEEDEPSLEGAVPSDSGPANIPPKPSYKEAPGMPGMRYDPDKPFGGGVDPEILAFLELDVRTALSIDELDDEQVASTDEDDPFSSLEGADDNPFELLEGADDTNVSDLLEGLDEPQDVAERSPQSPPSPEGADDDPFSSADDDPFSTPAPPEGGDVDELAGLLESTNEDVSGTQGWDVTKVEGADLPSEVIILTDIEPTGQVLDGVELALGSDTIIGREVGAERLKLMEQKTIHKPCLAKGARGTMFCIDNVSWPFELEEDFLVDTIMYQGTRAIARYDAGRASNFHTMFRSTSFEKVIGYYTQRYGQPSEIVERAIAPLAAPRQDNPTYLWQSREPGTDTITTLEIRKFDDAQGGGFPDTLRGVILLYRSHAKSIFPQLSQLELMVLKADATAAAEIGGGEAGADAGSIWN